MVSKARCHDRIALSPEQILLTCDRAQDLHQLADIRIHGVLHHHLRFTWTSIAVDIFVNAHTLLPDRVTSTRFNPFDIPQNALGDVRWTSDFLFWRREANGLFYPHQWNNSRNGKAISVDTVVTLARNPSLPSQSFDIPAAALSQFAARGHLPVDDYPFDGDHNMTQIADHLWLLSGSWNVLVLQQQDGLLVIECPESGAYSQKILDYLKMRFSGVPVKGLISTTDTLFHYAGVRTYVARGIPVYCLDLNVEPLRRLLATQHRIHPDELARHPQKANLTSVTRRVVIGTGPLRVEVYPIRGQSDERMMAVYFPSLELLYGSSNDIFVSADGVKQGTFNLPELAIWARRVGLPIATFVGIHTKPMPWSEALTIALGKPTAS